MSIISSWDRKYRHLHVPGTVVNPAKTNLANEIETHHCTTNLGTYLSYNVLSLSGHVRRMQFAILAQSPREMSQTDRMHPRYFLLRVRVSIRPRIFLYAKKLQTSHPLTDRPGRMLQRHRPSERRNLKGRLPRYTFTPGGDLRPRRLWVISLAPKTTPGDCRIIIRL